MEAPHNLKAWAPRSSIYEEVTARAITATNGTVNNLTTNKLCVNKSNGTPVCITGDQLASLLSGQPAVQVSQSAVTISSAGSSTPPTITINGENPAIIQVGDSYADLGATVTDTGSAQAGDANLGYKIFLNDMLVSNIAIDTSRVATDTFDYVTTDNNGLTATSSRTVIIEARACPLMVKRRIRPVRDPARQAHPRRLSRRASSSEWIAML